MSHKPKPVRDHYIESLTTNSQSLTRQLAASITETEARSIINSISAIYLREVANIVRQCEQDMMALETVPSPLGLFVRCISQIIKDVRSPAAVELLQKYVAAWEDWM